jgi:hypothetical protein
MQLIRIIFLLLLLISATCGLSAASNTRAIGIPRPTGTRVQDSPDGLVNSLEARGDHASQISDYYSTEGSYQVALALAEASRDKHQRVVTLRGHASAALEVHQYE